MSSGGTPPGEPQFPRTDAYRGEIEQLTEYVAVSEKGKTTLETGKGISHAVDLIKEGVSVDDAVTTAKKAEVVRKATAMARKGERVDRSIAQSTTKQLELSYYLSLMRILQLVKKETK